MPVSVRAGRTGNKLFPCGNDKDTGNGHTRHASVFDRLAVISEKQRHAVLATDDKGQPYRSLITFTLTPDRRSLIFATPRNSTKYRNIRNNRRVSVLIDTRSNTDRSYMHAEPVTVQGIARSVRNGRKRDALCRLFVRKHPRLAGFVRAESTGNRGDRDHQLPSRHVISASHRRLPLTFYT